MIEFTLKLLDSILKIKKLENHVPSNPIQISRNVGKNNHFLDIKYIQDFYRETNADMRALRDWESKMVNLYFQVSAFFFAGNILLIASANSYPQFIFLRLLIELISIAFLISFWFKLHFRIAHDNNSYAFNMSHKRFIEKKWFGGEYPKPPAHVANSPTGPGYRKMQSLVAISAIATCCVLSVGVIYSFVLIFNL